MNALNQVKSKALNWASQEIHFLAFSMNNECSHLGQKLDKSSYELPTPPFRLPIFGHLFSILKKENVEDLPGYFTRLREKYGDIFRMSLPGLGNGHIVLIFEPEDIKEMYKNDGRIPMLPNLSKFEYSRKVTFPERYPTVGLASNSEEWSTVRKLVQQDRTEMEREVKF